jgi:small basic protein
MWIPIIGLLIGLLIGGLLPGELSFANFPVIPPQINVIIVLSSTDALFNGFLAKLEGRFSPLFFSIEFLINSLIAVGMVYFGIIMSIDLFVAVTVIFGVRIFHNLSQINQKLFIHR